MSDLYDKSLHFLGQNKKDTVFFINIGAMDGIMFDDMHAYATTYYFKGLYVEPVPYLFERLKKNITPGNLFENSAIADFNGEIEMVTIDQNVIDNNLIHQCFYGMSSVYPPKNGLSSKDDKLTVDKYGKIIKVPCITFETLLSKHNITDFDIIQIDAEGHDYKILKQINLEKYKPKIIRFEWICLSEEELNSALNILKQNDYIYDKTAQDITAISKLLQFELYDFIAPLSNTPEITPEIASKIMSPQNVTLVTGLWNIGRSELEHGWSRKYDSYLEKFNELLDVPNNIIIFGDNELESYVWKKRTHDNTLFITRDFSWFKQNLYYEKIQEIRKDPKWYNQIGWLKESTQAKLEMYNPLVMSKMFLLNDARILDIFNSDLMFWIDAGLTFTVHPGYFTHDKVLTKLPKYINKFTFITFPYETTSEIHGFVFDKICEYAENKVNKVGRGGFFGGPKKMINQINSIYYNLLMDTLSNGCMGTEESIFSIILYKRPDLTNYIEIKEDGLLWRFFEDLKNDTIIVKNTYNQSRKIL